MKKYRIAFIPIYLLLALLLGLGVLLCLTAPRESRASLKENRMLAGAPVLSWESVFSGEFMTGLESFLSDGMVERDRIIDASNQLEKAMTLWAPKKTDEERLEEQVAAMAGGEEEPVPTEEPVQTFAPEPTQATESVSPEQTP